MADSCPNCGFPDTHDGWHYKGVYTFGDPCPHCRRVTEQRGLKPEIYQATQALLLSLARQVRLLPLEKFLESIETAEAVGPLVNPTLYIKAAHNLDEIKKMAEGALAFKNSLPPVCAFCKKKPLAYKGAKYCGAGCSARAEAHEEPPEEILE